MEDDHRNACRHRQPEWQPAAEFPLPSNGMLDPRELAILDEIAKWMSLNGEVIYGTRQWKTHGDGPGGVRGNGGAARRGRSSPGRAFNEAGRKPLTAVGIRFIGKGSIVYAFAMGRPEGQVAIPILALGGQIFYWQNPECRNGWCERQAELDARRKRFDDSD